MKFIQKLIRQASIKALDNLEDDENYHFVRQSRLFQDLSAEGFILIMKCLVERHYKQNEVIFNEGNPGICMFLVKKGRVEIFSQGKDGQVADLPTVYTILEAGTLFGEISIMSMSYRTSSAKALEQDTTLLTISTYDLEQLIEQYPQDGLRVLRGIVDSIVNHLVITDRRLGEANIQIKLLKEKLAKYE